MNNIQTVEGRLADLEKRVSALEKNATIDKDSSQQTEPIKSKSAKEFLLEKDPKNDMQRTLYLSYWLEKIQGIEAFNVNDLREAFRSARVPVPKNLNDKVNKNISKGYLMDVEADKSGKKMWVLTATGESYVETATDDQK